MSVNSSLSKLSQLKTGESRLKKEQSGHEVAAAKKRKDAASKRAAAQRTSSAASRKSLINAAVKLESEAAALDKRAANCSAKLADNARKQSQENTSLERARKSDASAQDRADRRRRDLEKRHAREIATISKPVVRHIHEIRHISPPKPEQLRVLYLTANPRILEEGEEGGEFYVVRIRVDKEVRDVRSEVARALHRDSIDIDHWPAATPIDLLNGLNEKKPHVVHFSGHGGGKALEFDDGVLDDPKGIPVEFEHLARALGSTKNPPVVLVLNACDTLDGAEVLLAAVPVVIATTREISDQAANLFATCFYRAIASGQSIRAAIDQSIYAIDVLAGGKGDVIASIARDDVDLDSLVLIELPEDS
ncbi:CHAT domain-containing protein [Streptomyces sp. NPDC020802]|uniref:CHAT domain-containing protein n=1 Tax=Streptomyces sp. NPDC020802 TaxID=3365094 RepID=UPI0037AFD957